MPSKLYVGNLSYQVTEDALSDLFGQAGSVASVQVITDRYSGRSKGFGFVEMSSDEEAQEAIGMFHGYSLEDRELTVEEARPQRRDRGRGGGREDRGRSGGY